MTVETERFSKRVENFFFALEVPYGLALLRIAFPLVLMGMVLPRWHVARELYSTDGAPAQLSVGYGYMDMLPEFSGTIVVALYGIMVFSMVCSSIGWCTRPSLIIFAILFTYFTMMDYVSSMTKYTVIATHVLTILALSQCGSLWSVDSWLAGRKKHSWPGEPSIAYEKFPAWPRRLIQIFIGVVYFGAAITKMHTPLFFTGDMLQYWMQTHINFKHPIGEYVSLYPILLVAFAYVTIVWEIMFVFLCWKSSWRLVILPIGICFHFMTTLTLGLLMFPMVCYCTYLTFMDEEDYRLIAKGFRRACRQSSWLKSAVAQITTVRERIGNPIGWQTSAKAAFVFSLALFAVGTVEVERWLDLYGERRPEGKYALTQIEPEEVAKLMAPTEPLRVKDRFLAVDTGSVLVGDRLANHRAQFRQGEMVIAQCNLIPPHEDMYVEFKLHDSENRIVSSQGNIATREQFRTNFNYALTESTPPGEYTLVVESAGQPVLRRKFVVHPKHGNAAAN